MKVEGKVGVAPVGPATGVCALRDGRTDKAMEIKRYSPGDKITQKAGEARAQGQTHVYQGGHKETVERNQREKGPSLEKTTL